MGRGWVPQNSSEVSCLLPITMISLCDPICKGLAVGCALAVFPHRLELNSGCEALGGRAVHSLRWAKIELVPSVTPPGGNGLRIYREVRKNRVGRTHNEVPLLSLSGLYAFILRYRV